MICPECNGKGEAIYYVETGRDENTVTVEQRKGICRTCNGSGAKQQTNADRIRAMSDDWIEWDSLHMLWFMTSLMPAKKSGTFRDGATTSLFLPLAKTLKITANKAKIQKIRISAVYLIRIYFIGRNNGKSETDRLSEAVHTEPKSEAAAEEKEGVAH